MYESYYGLSAKPFQLKPDPDFFFGSKNHKRAMAYLQYGLSQGEGFIVITGEVGAGKTTLVRNLFRELDATKIVAAQIVNTHLSSEDTLKLVAAGFGIPNSNATKADLLTRIEQFLRACNAEGRRALLVVDEAQNLNSQTVEELRMLSNFQTDDNSLLQTFLLGQPEFRTTMMGPDMLQLRQRVIASYHLGPMAVEETQTYIEHRLHTVGWSNDPSITDDAFIRIHEFAGGIPRKINTLCDRLLLMGYLEEIHEFAKSHIETVIQDLQSEFDHSDVILPSSLLPSDFSAQITDRDNIDVELILVRLSRIERALQSMLDAMTRLLFPSKNNPKSGDQPND